MKFSDFLKEQNVDLVEAAKIPDFVKSLNESASFKVRDFFKYVYGLIENDVDFSFQHADGAWECLYYSHNKKVDHKDINKKYGDLEVVSIESFEDDIWVSIKGVSFEDAKENLYK